MNSGHFCYSNCYTLNASRTQIKVEEQILIKKYSPLTFFLSTRPSPGLLPVLGLLKWYRRLHLTQPCFAALVLALIWVERQVVRMMLLLCLRERVLQRREPSVGDFIVSQKRFQWRMKLAFLWAGP